MSVTAMARAPGPISQCQSFNLPPRAQSKFALAILILSCGLLLPATSFAQDPPTEGGFQIQKTLNQLLGEENATRYKKILSPEELISWEVYLPDNSSNEIPGVFVYVSPTSSGEIGPRWRSVMDQQNLIFIAANDAGNKRYVERRMVLATMAIKVLGQHYLFDVEHINVAGFSGGGRVASKLASQYPEAFTGALYICGVDFWKKNQTPKVERLLQNRFVFLTGSRDFNREETQRIYRKYIKAGAQNSKLMVIPGMSHQLPDAPALVEALQFLKAAESPPRE